MLNRVEHRMLQTQHNTNCNDLTKRYTTQNKKQAQIKLKIISTTKRPTFPGNRPQTRLFGP